MFKQAVLRIIIKNKKKRRGAKLDEAIVKLKDTEKKLQEKSDLLESRIEQESVLARTHRLTNKRLALNALKRKHRFERQLSVLDASITNLELQRSALEDSPANKESIKTIGFAAKALKTAHGDLDIREVYKVMDDVSEQQNLSEEISSALSVSTPDLDRELLKELELLELGDTPDRVNEAPSPAKIFPKPQASDKNMIRESTIAF